ncbi:MAG: hypothetical protein K5764_04310 [Prevotella sp.]|nr:hypothetical protein [Prevotella sp.]
MQVKKYIEIPEEILVGLAEGRYVEGSLHRDEWTGRLIFKAYHRQPRKRPKDTLICQLATGWLKESRQRIKFFSSVKKELDVAEIHNVMERDLNKAMSELFMTKLAEKLKNV